MQAAQFDLALQMHGSGAYSNVFTLLLGARDAVGFVRAGHDPGRLTRALPYDETAREIDQLLDLVALVGAAPSGHATEFPLWADDHARAADLLAGAPRPLVGLHPAATDATKRWAPERFARFATEVQKCHGGTIVIVAGPGERETAQKVEELTRGRCLNLAGRTSLPVLGAVIVRLSVLVTNDSGPAHIAYALGRPSVTIFGATDPARWAPSRRPHLVLARPIACRPCGYTEDCPTHRACLRAVSVQDAVEAAEEAMVSA